MPPRPANGVTILTPIKFCLEHPLIYTASSLLCTVVVSIYVKASNIHSGAFLSQWRMYPWCCMVVFHSLVALSYCGYSLACHCLFGRTPTFSEHSTIGEKLVIFYSFKVILLGKSDESSCSFWNVIVPQSLLSLTSHIPHYLYTFIYYFLGVVIIEPDVFDFGMWLMWYVFFLNVSNVCCSTFSITFVMAHWTLGLLYWPSCFLSYFHSYGILHILYSHIATLLGMFLFLAWKVSYILVWCDWKIWPRKTTIPVRRLEELQSSHYCDILLILFLLLVLLCWVRSFGLSSITYPVWHDSD